MKYLALFLILTGCDDTHLKVQSIVNSEEIKSQVEQSLKYMWDDIASCDELAKCLGHKTGRVVSTRNEISCLQPDCDHFQLNLEFHCNFGNEKSVSLRDIGPMLEGCRNRKCDKDCKK